MAELNYDDIRPYSDEELPAIFEALLKDEEFLAVIKWLQLKWLPGFLFPLVRPFVRSRLREHTKALQTVSDFQNSVESHLQRCMEKTADQFTVSGTEGLDPDCQYLFVSNHRDIVMDPALCNLALHQAGRTTCRIAIGDNLLSKPFAEHLMRINKSFIVKRTFASNREKLKELKKLSSYIRKSVVEDLEAVWIAQSEGRAKNGIDRSDPTLIKMLALSKSKEQSFGEAVRQLNIIPVSVSYEWDPCDVAKARELASKTANGEYLKAEHEDIESISAGIRGRKGNVRIEFGQRLTGEYDSAEEVAEALDEQIIGMYQIHASHIAAYRKLNKEVPSGYASFYASDVVDAADEQLEERIRGLSEEEADILLHAYANPITSRMEIIGE